MTGGLVALSGGLSQGRNRGGHTWVFLQYLLGLARLGFDTLFLEPTISGSDQAACATTQWRSLSDLVRLLDWAGARARVALVDTSRDEVCASTPDGPLRDEPLALFNVMGFLSRGTGIQNVAPRVFIDIDPGYPQMWRDLGLADVFDGHDLFVTVGENVGRPDCGVPTCGLDWITTPQPVVLDQWPAVGGGGAFTTVATWRGPYGTVEYADKVLGSRVHEFRKFAQLPGLVDATFELALDIDSAEIGDLRLLERNGWQLVDPVAVAGDPLSYRSYIQASRAEFCVAKNMYVETRSGWFSDRSICYLASGKPVLAQDTGFSRNYPTGEGLIAFTTLEEAAAGVEAIEANYQRHSTAARELAAEYFDSDKVLRRLLEKIGVG